MCESSLQINQAVYCIIVYVEIHVKTKIQIYTKYA